MYDLPQLDLTVEVYSRQFLEDCIADKTDLVAFDGSLVFGGESFPFVAQFDVNGYGLYVDKLSGEVGGKLQQLLVEKYG